MLKNIFKKLNIENKDILVIGCSAGPDSMALLHYLKTNTTNQLVVAHINHNLRIQSKKEEKYLKNYCTKHNIIFESTKIDTYQPKNIESQAREKRYIFYEKILNKYNTSYLFLAHHGDDLIETILMKIERGSNIEGYAGIKEITNKTNYHNYYIIRPFLNLTKQDLIKYNKINHLKYYIDKTNYDTKYKRNWYRKKILPILKKENINIHKQYLKYSKTLIEQTEYLNHETNNYLTKVYKDNYLTLDKFKQIHLFMQKQIIYKILNNIYLDKPNIIKDKHITNILNMINTNIPNQTLNLPQNLIIKKEYNKLYFLYNHKIDNKDYKIKFTDEFILNNHKIIKIDNTNETGNNICRLNSNNIKLPLYIRNKKDGDTIELKSLNKHKKIKEIFIEKKIPKSLRDNYPILTDAHDNILWIPNLKKSKFDGSNNDFYDIILKYCEKEEKNEQ